METCASASDVIAKPATNAMNACLKTEPLKVMKGVDELPEPNHWLGDRDVALNLRIGGIGGELPP
jgi:hypothetical protein